MYYYQIALLKSPLDPLTYASDVKLVLGMLVEGTLSKRTIHGVVLEEVAKPSFSCEKVQPQKDAYYSKSMIRLARFISEYYICSLGEALALFTPFTQPNSFSANNAFDTSIQLSSEHRDEARLMVLDRKTQTIEHKLFKDVIDYFNEDDLFIFNNTKVFPARLDRTSVV